MGSSDAELMLGDPTENGKEFRFLHVGVTHALPADGLEVRREVARHKKDPIPVVHGLVCGVQPHAKVNSTLEILEECLSWVKAHVE